MPGLDQSLFNLQSNHVFNPSFSSFFCDFLKSKFFYRDRYGYFLDRGQEKFEDSLPDYVMVSFLNSKMSDPWRRRRNLWAFWAFLFGRINPQVFFLFFWTLVHLASLVKNGQVFTLVFREKLYHSLPRLFFEVLPSAFFGGLIAAFDSAHDSRSISQKIDICLSHPYSQKLVNIGRKDSMMLILSAFGHTSNRIQFAVTVIVPSGVKSI